MGYTVFFLIFENLTLDTLTTFYLFFEEIGYTPKSKEFVTPCTISVFCGVFQILFFFPQFPISFSYSITILFQLIKKYVNGINAQIIIIKYDLGRVYGTRFLRLTEYRFFFNIL